ncbi:MAG: ABC transporter ATP-binding protein [Anaerolineales bacterium]
MLKIQNLSASYHNRRVLHDVSFDVASGEVLALIGPNGAGKSTLIRAVSGVIPSQGEVYANGVNLQTLDAPRRARALAVAPQAAGLPPAFTVWQTVIMGRTPYLGFLGQTSPHDEEIALSALRRVHADGLIQRPIGELSGGERQRVLLARALCQAAPILLLDEPIAHLDLQYQVSIMELIRSLAREESLAVLVALHDLNLAAQYADRVALLVGGELRALGAPRQALTADIISSAYCLPVQVVEHPLMNSPLVLPLGK